MLYFIFLGVCIAILMFLPSFWVKKVMRKYDKPHPTLPGTANEYLQHLCKKYVLSDIEIKADNNNFYDPTTQSIHLEKKYLETNSLTAITIAAHEFGHALQHRNKEKIFLNRIKLITIANKIQKVSSFAALLAPVTTIASKSPLLGFVILGLGALPMFYTVVIHWYTLPVEYDASYNKALVILEEGGFLSSQDMRQARRILQAAALTYVATSLASLLNIWRWIKIYKR